MIFTLNSAVTRHSNELSDFKIEALNSYCGANLEAPPTLTSLAIPMPMPMPMPMPLLDVHIDIHIDLLTYLLVYYTCTGTRVHTLPGSMLLESRQTNRLLPVLQY